MRRISLTAALIALSLLGTVHAQPSAPTLLFADATSLANLAIDPTCQAFGVPIDVKIGTAYAGPALSSCFAGVEALTASFALATRDASPDPASVHFKVSAAGVISNDGVGLTAQSGTLWLRRVTSDGIALEVSLPWRIMP